MHQFEYHAGELRCEGVAVADIAGAVGTPTFVYSAATLRAHFDRLAAAFAPLSPVICYSIKSCSNLHICRLLRERGAGFDVVSGGELFRALRAGGDPQKIVFAGVGKTVEELHAGINARIGWFNIESPSELEVLDTLAAEHGARVNAALRINPNVDGHTHAYTTTGKRETKFGVDIDHAAEVFSQHRMRRGAESIDPAASVRPGVRLCGVHIHIGSPINTVRPYVQAVARTLELISTLRAAGHVIDMLDIGGGFGAHYRGSEAPAALAYAAELVPMLRQRGLQIVIEPGRCLVANAGIVVSRVLHIKQSGNKHFVICDAGMNDLVRPALYDAYHAIWPVKTDLPVPNEDAPATEVAAALFEQDVVGPVCETGDFLARSRSLPAMRRGDLIAVFTAGAYGMSMSSNYNSRPRAAEVLVEGNEYRVIRRRETHEDLIRCEEA